MGYSLWCWRDFPRNGWKFLDNYVFPPTAYTDEFVWVMHVISMYPKPINLHIPNQVILDYIVFKLIKNLNQKLKRETDSYQI